MIGPRRNRKIATRLVSLMVLTTVSCASKTKAPDSLKEVLRPGVAATDRGAYPPHWWAPVPPASAAWWEILPQAAQPGEVILSKRNELGLLSNFAPTSFVYRKKTYASVEGFWQSLLYPESDQDPRAKGMGIEWKHRRSDVEKMVGFDAKEAGNLAKENMKKLGIDWVSFEGRQMKYRDGGTGDHYKLILEVMRAKADQNPEVKNVLLSTGDLLLKPDHSQEPDAGPAWKYNEIWMKIRKEYRAAEQSESNR